MTDNSFTKGALIVFLVIFIFIFAVAISGNNVIYFAKALGAQFLFAGFSYLIYSTYKDAIPIFNKNTKFAVIVGVSIGLLYVFLSRLIPGLTIGIPLIPSSISGNLRWFTVNIVSPIIETIFAFGALLIIIKRTDFGRKHQILSVLFVGLFVSLLHLGAYVLGIVDLPFSEALGAFSGNLGAFLSAFIFFTLSGFLVVWKKTQNLIVAIIPHFIVNFSTFVKSVVVLG